MAASTYRDKFLKLVDKGYLVQRGSGNTYDFYETPQRETRLHNENTPVGLDFTAAVQKQTQAVQKEAPEDIEININILTTLIISKKPGNTGISRDIRTEFTTDLLLSD